MLTVNDSEKKLTILIVDDDEIDRMAVKRSLKSSALNIKIEEAKSAIECISILKCEQFDCVFLDYLLPDGDGLTTLKSLRAAEINVPVIMLTGHGNEELIVEMIQAGASDYIPKGKMKPDVLEHSIRNAIRICSIDEARREAVDELKKSNKKNIDILESITDAFMAIDNEWCFSYLNSQAEQFIRQERAELIGKEIWPYLMKISSWFHELLRKAMTEKVSVSREGLCGSQDMWIETHVYPNQEGISVYINDITERKRDQQALQRDKEEQKILISKLKSTQNQLLQSEKMASIGQLAAGMAHEINNPIGYINSNLGTMLDHIKALLTVLAAYNEHDALLAQDVEAYKHIQEIKKQTELEYLKEDIIELINESKEGVSRVMSIVQDLKDFSHVDEADWQCVDLHRGLDSTLNIANNEIKYTAEVIKEYGDLPLVECIPAQINQVIMNILVNAAHSIETNGTITIRTGTNGEEAWLEISDTGRGISSEHITRIFDPFFTTKPVGKGTGLGLSLSYGILEKHGGRLEVDSEVGKGSTFRICLPVRHKQHKDLTDNS